MRFSATALTVSILSLIVLVPLRPQDPPPVVPVSANRDWAKVPDGMRRARTLILAVEAADFNYRVPGGGTAVLPSANRFTVFPMPPGYVEPNPVPGLGGLFKTMANGAYAVGNRGTFTIGNAVRRAVASWNLADTGWKLVENEQPYTLRPMIIVRMSRPSYLDAHNRVVPEELTDPFGGGPPPSIPIPIDGAKDSGNPDSGGGRGNGKVLAFFQCIAPGGADGQKNCQYGQIVFNRNAFPGNPNARWAWGIDRNMNAQNSNTNDTFDPIITGLHEIGHAFRLEHENTNNGIDSTNPDGNVMRASLEKEIHRTNSNFNAANPAATFDRNPGAGDKTAAMNSAQNPLP